MRNGIELRTADRERTADFLTQWQVAFDELPDGTIAVAAREAPGSSFHANSYGNLSTDFRKLIG